MVLVFASSPQHSTEQHSIPVRGQCEGVVQARGKTEEDVAALLDAGVYDMQKLLDGGWVTGLKYADEVQVRLPTPS